MQADSAGAVQDFYERFPYPPPVDSLDTYRRHWLDPQRRRADYHLFWPAQSYRDDFSILVAGCGTSQAAKHALRWRAARVTGIDFSAASVRCTQALQRKYDLDNLQVHHLPIERIGELGRSFDQIVCTGVLHHLPDPDAGLRSLAGVLKPDGVMHLMVYAKYGRTGVYILQEFCRRTGIEATDDGMRDLLAVLESLPSGHPLTQLLRHAPDFRQRAALADALLHPQDRAYSVPELFDFLEGGGLRFGRWVRQAPYSPRCGVMATIPQSGRLAELPAADQYAAAELFRGTMVRHTVAAYRHDHPGDPPGVSFVGDAWLDYIPIRMPDTICIQQRLPAGAAAVLINQSHTDTDLFVPVDSAEKRLFDAIDGECTIGDLVERVPPSAGDTPRLDIARGFFERLWWSDQVVFDASRVLPPLFAGGGVRSQSGVPR
jgi:SAM-dependent methyltransferase